MIGRTISHYEILSRLGEGGMGEVYLARDSTLDRKVALKVLPPELAIDRDRRERFEREAKVIAALNHPNIVTIFSVEEAEGLHFLTLEWVDGKTLAEMLTAGPLAVGRLFEIATTLAGALHAAHERGIIHRDLKHLWNKRTPTELQSSIRLFSQAIDRDPGYALAHAGVADSYTILGYYSAREPRDAFPKAKAAATRALAIDDSLAQAHSSLAFAQVLYDWDWEGAARGFQRTFELNPGYATGHHWYAEYLVWTGRGEEAVAEAKKALEIDPLSLIINTLVGWVDYYTRRYNRAIRKLRKTLELDPGFAPANFWLALAQAQAGNLDAAKEALERALESARESPMMLAARANLHAISGETAAAEGILAALQQAAEKAYVPPYYIAAIYSALGDWPQAVAWLEKARQGRDNWLVFLEVDPIWDRFRAESEFAALLRQVGFEP